MSKSKALPALDLMQSYLIQEIKELAENFGLPPGALISAVSPSFGLRAAYRRKSKDSPDINSLTEELDRITTARASSLPILSVDLRKIPKIPNPYDFHPNEYKGKSTYVDSNGLTTEVPPNSTHSVNRESPSSQDSPTENQKASPSLIDPDFASSLDTTERVINQASVTTTAAVTNVSTEPLILIAIDSLNPAYVNLDRYGNGLGSAGNWLMPNVRDFREASADWKNAKAWAPYYTDNNHLNALAATNPGKSGIYGVNFQVFGWDSEGVVTGATSPENAKYPNGDPVQTLFDLFESTTNGAVKTAFVSGKDWVAENYASTVDFISNGPNPRYSLSPTTVNYYDNPETDPDAEYDPESLTQIITSAILNNDVAAHPSDHWLVNETLQILTNDQPDVIYILMAQLDQSQHGLGALDINENGLPIEWEQGFAPWGIPRGLFEARYRLISPRNNRLRKEPILDTIWDVDQAFGKLIAGIEEIPYYENANIVLLSDHNMITHQNQNSLRGATNIKSILGNNGLVADGQALDVVSYGSTALIFARPGSDPNLVVQATDILGSYTLVNPETGQSEIPWDIVTRDDMIAGRPDLNIEPGELYNPYSVDLGIWPQLFLLAKNGWQFPFETDVADAAGTVLLGGHGSNDTDEIMMSIQGMGYSIGSYSSPVRISDLGITVMDYYGLPLPNGGDLVGTVLPVN